MVEKHAVLLVIFLIEMFREFPTSWILPTIIACAKVWLLYTSHSSIQKEKDEFERKMKEALRENGAEKEKRESKERDDRERRRVLSEIQQALQLENESLKKEVQRLRSEIENLKAESEISQLKHQVELAREQKKSMEVLDLKIRRYEKEIELLKIEADINEKRNEKRRKVENDIMRCELQMKYEGKKKDELEKRIEKLKMGLTAMDRALDVHPPNWNSLELSTTGIVFEFTLSSTGDQWVLQESGKRRDSILINQNPFAKGAFRFAYHGKLGSSKKVFKELIFSGSFSDDLAEHKENARLHLIAQNFAQEFNKALPVAAPRIHYGNVQIIQFDFKGRETCMLAEDFLDGSFAKFNGNGEYINLAAEFEGAQAFSHFTYIKSGKKMIICDLQGIFKENQFFMTDPACHCEGEGFGDTNHGQKGIQKVMSLHKCNKFCSLFAFS